MTEATLKDTMGVINEIFQLCHSHPELAAIAQGGAAQIASECAQSIEPSNRAQEAIREHLAALKKKGKQINSPILVYREIAE
jgi:hypothetical protein